MHVVGSRGGYVTVRGCAPFNTDSFSAGFQRGMAGTYWRGSSSFSLCDYNNCNGAATVGIGAAIILAASMLVANL